MNDISVMMTSIDQDLQIVDCKNRRKHIYYNRWAKMKAKCYNKNHSQYKYYGEKGIGVFEEWKNDFCKYLQYLSTLDGFMDPNLTIDRINNDDDYKPENLRFVTKKIQAQNTRVLRITNNSGYRGVSKKRK